MKQKARHPSRILIVDDSAHMRRYIAVTLGAAEYDVSEAQDGVEALEAMAARRFDMVITDLDMSGMGGVELTRTLLALGEQRPRIVVCSGRLDALKDGEAGPIAACDGRLPKPFVPQDLLVLVSKILN